MRDQSRSMRATILSIAVLCVPCATACAQEEFQRIVERLDDDDAGAREAAQADLESWCDRAGEGAAEALRARVEGASPEVRARLEEQLHFSANLVDTRRVIAIYDSLDPEALGLPPKDLRASCEGVLVEDWSHVRVTRETASDCDYPHFEKAIRHARWAFDGGDRHAAVALVEKSEAWLSGLFQDPAKAAWGPRPDLREVCASTFAARLRGEAISRAHTGAPRSDLLAAWKRIAAVPSKRWGAEAQATVLAYVSLLGEDTGWKDLTDDDVASLPVPAQVDYWFHELREIAEEQHGWPGSCEVVSCFCRAGFKPRNAAEQLVSLGWAALPRVIEHLDDDRPTRSVGSEEWRSSCDLVSHGDCCEQIFEAITGIDLRPSHRDDSDPPKAIAERWWRDLGSRGQEEAFSVQLDSRDEQQAAHAARWLLDKDPQRYLARAMARASAERSDRRCNLVWAVVRHVSKEQGPWLRGLLGEQEELYTVAAAAERLASECDSDDGLDVLASRLLAGRAEDRGDLCSGHPLSVLARSRRTHGVDLFLTCLREGSKPVRVSAMEGATWSFEPRIAEALVRELDDRDPTGSRDGQGAIRFCDVAAESLTEMLGDYGLFDRREPEARRDLRIENLKGWWATHGGSIDWEDLRRTREAPAKPG